MVVKCETRHAGLRIKPTEREKEVEVVVEKMKHGAGSSLLVRRGKSRPRTKQKMLLEAVSSDGAMVKMKLQTIRCCRVQSWHHYVSKAVGI